jgi:hypothetical protein
LSIATHANGAFDQDWYRFVQPNAGTFSVNLTNIQVTPSTGDLHVRIFNLNPDNTLTELGNSTRVGGFTTQGTSVPIAAGSTIYVWVYGFNYAQGNYTLNLNFS